MLEGKSITGPLEPLSNFVLVKVREAKAQTLGGIVIPDQAKEKPTEGIVVGVGPGKLNVDTNVLTPMPVALGQRVLYGKFDGSKVEHIFIYLFLSFSSLDFLQLVPKPMMELRCCMTAPTTHWFEMTIFFSDIRVMK